MDNGLFYLIALILLSGAFSGAEIALTSITKSKLRALEEDMRIGSKAIIRLKEKPQRLLISILVGNQAVNVLATVIATIWGLSLFGEDRISLVTLVFTIVLILFGSIIPKTISLRFSETFARFISFPLLGYYYLATPIVWLFELFAIGFMKVLRMDTKNFPTNTNSQEIEAMLDIGAEEGVIKEEDEDLMKQILKFDKTTAEDIMTVLQDVNAIDISSSFDEIEKYVYEHNHTIFPAYEDDMNNLKGTISQYTLFKLLHSSKKKHPLIDYKFTPIILVPRTSSITELFKLFKEKKERMAIVIDEHGQTIGVVTLGDILEDMAGEKIEHNDENKEKKTIKKIAKNLWIVDGEASIDELNEEIGHKLPHPEHDTVSLMILEALKRFPKPKEKVRIDHIEIEILKLSKKTINKVLVKNIKKVGKNTKE